MIVRDGGQLFASLLEGATGHVDEIIVGDTGSSDLSRSTAEQAGARVYEIPWTDDFAAARNAVLQHCTGKWILVMDADEAICPRGWQEITAWVQDRNTHAVPVAASIQTRNYLPGRHLKRGWQATPQPDHYQLLTGNPAAGFVPSTKVRIFPNQPGIRFHGQLHETVEGSLRNLGIPVVELPVPVHHFGLLPEYQHPDQQTHKDQQYLKLARRKASTNPHLPQAWSELAELALACAELELALSAIERALILNPIKSDFRFTAALVLKELGRLDEAQNHLITATNSGPLCDSLTAEVAHLQAQILMLQGKTQAAGHHLHCALRQVPGNAIFLNTLGAWHLLNGQGEEARAALEKAHQICPVAVDPLLNLGILYQAANQPQLAEDHFRRVLALQPGNPKATLRLAEIQSQIQSVL